MAKNILEEAMEDARLLKETAIENAKNVLVEAISPKIKEFVDAQLGEAPAAMVAGMQPQVEAGMYEKHDDAEQDMELMKKLGLVDGADAQNKHEDEDEEMDESLMSALGVTEAEDKEKEEKEEEKVEEVMEITDNDLRAALSEVLGGMKLKTEASVSKGFGDAKSADEGGLLDKKSGEHMFSDETPPAAQDFTVKESVYKNKIAALEKANATLKSENKEYKQACDFLKRNLQEVNIFNSKLLYTNKLLHSAELNNKARLAVIEAFDRATNLREVELVYKSLSESLKIAGVLGESKQAQRTMKGPKGSRPTTSSSAVLNESANKEESAADNFALRMQELAGLVD